MKPLIIVESAMEIAHSQEVLDKINVKYGPERARACAMSNSVGGIGPLLKERIPAQAELGHEVIGVSLLYDHVWTQGFYQWGQIYIEKKSVAHRFREILENAGFQISLELPDGTVKKVNVWKAPLGKAVVYYLDQPEIADVVYPGPEDAPKDAPDSNAWVENQKLLQSWLIGRGTLALLKTLGKKPDVIVQSETPTIFANHSLVKDAFQKDPFFDGARYVFNDHTPLEYAHPIWNESQAAKAKLDVKVNGTVDITRLLIERSHKTYGVSKKHETVMKAMPSLKGLESKITSITNGVSIQNWQAPAFAGHKTMSNEELIRAKESQKAELINWVQKRYRLWASWRAKAQGKFLVNWTRRVTSYKRFDILEQMLTNPELKKRFLATDIVILMGGRIHQNDNLSQNVMFSLLDLVNRDKALQDRVLVLDNYNIWEAPKIFHGVDGSIMLADDGKEASATGFMKAQVNGAIVIAVADGAIPESVHFLRSERPKSSGGTENGFHVPYINGRILPENLLAALEKLGRLYQDPKSRAAMIRSAFAVESQVSIDRAAREMIELYDQILRHT